MNQLDSYGVVERKGQPVVSSRAIAEKFNKSHDDVLKSIRNLIIGLEEIVDFSTLSREISLGSFTESNYKARGKLYPEYLIDRDGFSLLAMGFTGKRALKWKIQYMNAFNQMAEFIESLQIAKLEFPAFTKAIMDSHEEPKHYHFSNEINMINKIVLGMNANKFKEANGLDKKISSIRPYLTVEQIQSIETLQRIDIGLIVAISDYQERKTILEQQYNRMKAKKLSA